MALSSTAAFCGQCSTRMTELLLSMLKGAAVDLFPNSGGQNPLAWRAFHGLLVCTRNCFKTNLFGVCGMGGLPLLKAEEVRT